MPLAALLLGVLLGLSLAAPPGPMNALIAQHATQAWGRGVRVGVAAPLADTLYLGLFAFGIGPALARPTLLRVLAAAGAVLMSWYAVQAWRSRQGPAPAHGFGKAFVLAVTNPFQIAWWLTAGTVFIHDQGAWGLAGFLLGIFGWVVVFSGLVALGARSWTWFTPIVRVISAGSLAVFAGLLILWAAGVRVR